MGRVRVRERVRVGEKKGISWLVYYKNSVSGSVDGARIIRVGSRKGADGGSSTP